MCLVMHRSRAGARRHRHRGEAEIVTAPSRVEPARMPAASPRPSPSRASTSGSSATEQPVAQPQRDATRPARGLDTVRASNPALIVMVSP